MTSSKFSLPLCLWALQYGAIEGMLTSAHPVKRPALCLHFQEGMWTDVEPDWRFPNGKSAVERAPGFHSLPHLLLY